MKTVALGLVSLVLAASSAQATTFSFASDSDNSAFTWAGLRNAITNGSSPLSNSITLVIDDENGPAPSLTYSVAFNANFQISFANSTAVGGGRFLHAYDVNASVPEGAAQFSFVNPDGSTLLTATFTGGSLSALGTQNAWGTTGGVDATDITGQVTYTWFGPDLAAYGLFSGQSSVGTDDATFTLTNLQTVGGGAGVTLGSGGLPGANWVSEGSFSGTARFVPAPGAMVLMGLGGLVMARRRRD